MSGKVGKVNVPVMGNPYLYLTDTYDEDIAWDPIESLGETPGSTDLDISPIILTEMINAASEVCKDYQVPTTIRPGTRVWGMEVGDDRTDVGRDPIRLALGLITQEQVFAMETSHEDTSISNSIWNFCEITNGIPADVTETFDYCRKNANFKSLGFVDVPPLRIILDVSKGDGSHSSTASGKAAMLGNRMRTPKTEFLRVLHLASFIQDGMLRTSISPDPKYLPRIMGGSGVRPLFENPDNVYLYTHAYRGGRCNRVYGSATRELWSCLSSLARGKATMPVLCRMLGDKQEYLHGTYSNMIFAPKYSYKDVELERLPAPLIESPGGANRFNASLNRLVRTKHLIPRSGALREWEYSKTIRARLLSRIETGRLVWEEQYRKSALRREFGDALYANTAFAHLIRRQATYSDVEKLLMSDKHLTITSGASEFSRSDAHWLSSGAKYEDFDPEDLTITEDLHSREDVSEEQTFKVGGLTLRPIRGNIVTRVKTTTRVGLYEIGMSMEEWARDLYSRLLLGREEGKPLKRDFVLSEIMKDPEWVNDDTGLIELCLHLTRDLHQRSARVVLVSLDRRLANQMSNTCNVQVERLPPLPYILRMRREGLDPIKDRERALTVFGKEILHRERSDPVRAVYVDTGSVAHTLSNMEEEGNQWSPVQKIRDHLSSGVDDNGHRFTSYYLREVPEDKRTLNTRPVRPVLRDRKFPHRKSGDSIPRPHPWSMGGSSVGTGSLTASRH